MGSVGSAGAGAGDAAASATVRSDHLMEALGGGGVQVKNELHADSQMKISPGWEGF